MNNVYDIIDILRKWRGLTMKDLSERASLSYTTLASMMSRRPDKIAINTLDKISQVFGVEVHQMLCKQHPFTQIPSRNLNGFRVSAVLDEEEVHCVLKSIIGENYEQFISAPEPPRIVALKTSDDFSRIRFRDIRSQFKSCIDLVFDNLNEDGVIEAMRYILELTQNPKYTVSTDQTTKEDNKCQEDEQ